MDEMIRYIFGNMQKTEHYVASQKNLNTAICKTIQKQRKTINRLALFTGVLIGVAYAQYQKTDSLEFQLKKLERELKAIQTNA